MHSCLFLPWFYGAGKQITISKKIRTGKLMDITAIISDTGKRVEQLFVDRLEGVAVNEFDDLLELRNLKGENTGYTKVWRGNGNTKISSMSIDIMPGKARYFNLQVVPDHSLRMPRYVFEGMVMGHNCLLSVDLYPDVDMIENLDWVLEKYTAIGEVFDEIRDKEDFDFCISRTLHMRAFCSPVFLLSRTLPVEQAPAFEGFAEQYMNCWFDLLATAEKGDEAETEQRRARRKYISDQTIALDPDRKMVVGVYGEEVTQRIEEASMYWEA